MNSFVYRGFVGVFKLVANCYLNGLVPEESERINVVLDKINAIDLTDSEYKELILFKNISREAKFGFTIGGYASLRKSTLIPVN